MSNITQAKQLVSNHAGKIISIFFLTFLMTLPAIVLSFIPLGFILVLILSLYMSVVEYNALKLNVLEEKEIGWGELLTGGWEAFSNNAGAICMEYLFVFLKVLAISVIYIIIAMMSIGGMIFNPFLGSLIFILCLIVFCIAAMLISYGFEYIVAGFVMGLTKEEAKELRNNHRGDVWGMSWRLSLMSLIPFVGIIFVVIYGYRYGVKMLLDAKDVARPKVQDAEVVSEVSFE